LCHEAGTTNHNSQAKYKGISLNHGLTIGYAMIIFWLRKKLFKNSKNDYEMRFIANSLVFFEGVTLLCASKRGSI